MSNLRADVDLSPAIRALSRQLNLWAVASIAWGLFRLFREDFVETGFALALVVLGVAAFYVRSPAMLPVFAVAFFWSGILSVLAFSPWWLGVGILQIFASIVILRAFRNYSHLQEHHVIDYSTLENPSLRLFQATDKFPVLSATMAGAALVEVLVAVVVSVLVIVSSLDKSMDEILEIVLPYMYLAYLVEPLAVFAFALGLSSHLARQHPRVLATVGMTLGGLIMLGFIIIALIAVVGPPVLP